MAQEILVWILGIASTLFGGLNIFQWLTLRSYKRVKAAEAATAEINSLSEIIKQNQAEIGRLAQRVLLADQRAVEQDNKYNALSEKYDALYQKYDAIRDEFEQYKSNHK